MIEESKSRVNGNHKFESHRLLKLRCKHCMGFALEPIHVVGGVPPKYNFTEADLRFLKEVECADFGKYGL